MLAQRIIQTQHLNRLFSTPPPRFFVHQRHPFVIHRLLRPRRVAEEPRQVCLVCTFDDASGDIRHTFIGQRESGPPRGHQPGQIIRKMLKLAPVIEDVCKLLPIFLHYRRDLHDWQFQFHTCTIPHFGKSQLSSYKTKKDQAHAIADFKKCLELDIDPTLRAKVTKELKELEAEK